MATALTEAKIPFEVHIFPNGPHGMALANEVTAVDERMIEPRVAKWPKLADGWMKEVK